MDLGCGLGQDVCDLARQVGLGGLVIGVDRSETMVYEARQRAADLHLPVEFHVGDASQLDFPDDYVDGSRADRVFHHLEDPRRALAHMIRVTRPGGRIVLVEPDFESTIVDSPDRVLTRKLLNLYCDNVSNGWMGRQLRALLLDASLEEVEVQPVPFVFTDYATGNVVLWLERTAAQAVEAGLASADETDRWIRQLKDADQIGRFYAMLVGFIAWGRKPS